MRKFSKFEKSYESRKYSGGKGNVSKGGALGNQTDKLSQRKLPGHISVDAASTIPHTRGCECFKQVEKSSKKMDY